MTSSYVFRRSLGSVLRSAHCEPDSEVVPADSRSRRKRRNKTKITKIRKTRVSESGFLFLGSVEVPWCTRHLHGSAPRRLSIGCCFEGGKCKIDEVHCGRAREERKKEKVLLSRSSCFFV